MTSLCDHSFLSSDLMGLTRTHYSDEAIVMMRVPPDDKQAINDEERKVIQWCQQITWAVTKPVKQTVGD